MSDAARVSSELRSARDRARAEAVSTLRRLEEATVEALGGDTLRGVRSLLPHEYPPFHAVAIRGNRVHGIDSFLPADGRRALVWTKRGELHFAVKVGLRGAESEPARDDELAAQDLEPAALALREALERHCSHAEDTIDSYRFVLSLVDRLGTALGDP